METKFEKHYPFNKKDIGNWVHFSSPYHTPHWFISMPWYKRVWGLLKWKLRREKDGVWYEISDIYNFRNAIISGGTESIYGLQRKPGESDEDLKLRIAQVKGITLKVKDDV